MRFLDAAFMLGMFAFPVWIFRRVPRDLSHEETLPRFRLVRRGVIVAIWYAGAMNVLAIVILLTASLAKHWAELMALAVIYSPFLVNSILAHVLLKRRHRAGLWLAGFAALIYIITPCEETQQPPLVQPAFLLDAAGRGAGY